MASQGLGTIRTTGNSRPPRGGWAWRGILAALLALSLLAPGARAEMSFEWATGVGGTDTTELFRYIGNAVALDEEGNVYTTGRFRQTAHFGPFQIDSEGNDDIFVAKQGPDGTFLWARAVGGIGDDVGNGIAVDDAGNVYTTGHFWGAVDFDPGPGTLSLTSAGGRDIFVQKLDADGDFVWAQAMGGTSGDQGNDIVVDSAGNVYTTGHFLNTVDFDPGPGVFNLTSAGSTDIFVQKLDVDGNLLWARVLGGSNAATGAGIEVDGAGNVYTTGWFQGTVDFDPGISNFSLTSAGDRDGFVSKLDANGDFVWAGVMGGEEEFRSLGVAVDDAGDVYTTGWFFGTANFDPGPETFNLTSAGHSNTFVSKWNTNGDFLWARSMGGTGQNVGVGIAVDALRNVYTAGYFLGTTDFAPGFGNFILTSGSVQDAFVSKLDVNGNFVWAGAMSANVVFTYGIAADSVGRVYTTGTFLGIGDFDPGPGTFNLSSSGNSSIFVVKLSGPPSAISITPSTTGPTNASSIDFTVEFHKPVESFDSDWDLVITHTDTANTGASITGGPEVYTVTVEGISGDGSFTLSVNTASDVVDLAGNPLASSVTSVPVVIDHTAPTISALTVSPSALEPGDGALIQFEVSEMLLGDPLVQVAGSTAGVAPLESVKSLGHSYHWVAPLGAPVGRIIGRPIVPGIGYVNPDPWPYGPRDIAITLTDLAGNTVTHTAPEGIFLVSGLPLAWPGLAVVAMLFAVVFVVRRSR